MSASTARLKILKIPILNIIAEADELNLAKIKDLAPQMVDQYGLSFDGTSSVKVKFEGLASRPAGRQNPGGGFCQKCERLQQ